MGWRSKRRKRRHNSMIDRIIRMTDRSHWKEELILAHHEKTCLCHMRTTKAQISMRIRCLASLIPLVSISNI